MEAPLSWRNRVLRRVGAEIRNILPAWIYLLLSFSLLRLTVVAAFQEQGVALPPSRVLLGSLIVAKALLTVDSLRLFPKLETRPILVAALLRTLLYAALVFVFQFMDALLTWRHEGVRRGSAEFAGALSSLRFWVLEIWLLILLTLFGVIRTFSRRLGREHFRRMLIGR